VYFYFNFAEKTAVDTGQSDDESLDETLDYPIAFNLNYYRPSFFVLEAEPEVTALVRQFGLVVMDPQMQGMGVDVLIDATSPKFAAQAIRKAYDIGWKPLHDG